MTNNGKFPIRCVWNWCKKLGKEQLKFPYVIYGVRRTDSINFILFVYFSLILLVHFYLLHEHSALMLV